MAKTAADLSHQAHLDGDSDGLGAARGIRNALLIEGLAIIGFGIFLFHFWK